MLLDILDGRETTRGGHSWLEREFLRLLASIDLPRPATQAVLTTAGDRLVRVDCRFPGTPVVVELLGYRWHRTKAQLARDSERLNALVLDGFTPYQFTYDQVVTQSDTVLATVHLALLAPPGRPEPLCASEQARHQRPLEHPGPRGGQDVMKPS